MNEGVDGFMEKLGLTIYDDNGNTMNLSSYLVEDTNLVNRGGSNCLGGGSCTSCNLQMMILS